MASKILVAVSVGTSLLENFLNNLSMSDDDKKKYKNYREFKRQKRKEYEANPEEFLKQLWKPDSAEISSIEKFYEMKGIQKSDLKICLISTKGTEKISEFIKKSLEDDFEYQDVFIENSNFDITNVKETTRGFLKTLDKLRNKAEESGNDFVIISSGGYKILSDYLYWFSTIYKIPLYYMHEEMKRLVEIPLTPLYWDYRVFVNYVTRLKVDAESIDPLGYIKDYIEDIKEDLLYNEPTIKYIKNREYRKIIKEALPIWCNLWIGDLIPETVEHSQKHSRRLLERFEMLLEDNPNFFTDYGLTNDDLRDKFLLLLISAAYLHDIGHTVLSFQTADGEFVSLKKLPEVVREFHNIFSVYEISTNRQFLGLDRFDDDLFNALRLVVLYHRKKMKLATELDLSKEKEKYAKELLEEKLNYQERLTYSPLIENEVFWKLESEIKEITLKVAALLKFLDELDVQADRVVDENYRRVREKRTENEIREIIENSSDQNKEKLKEYLKYICRDNLEKFEKLRSDRYKKMYEKLFYGNKLDEPFINELQIIFKVSQFDHFKKHSKIEYVVPQLRKDKILEIKIFCDDPEIFEEVKGEINKQVDLLREDEKVINSKFGDLKLLPFKDVRYIRISR